MAEVAVTSRLVLRDWTEADRRAFYDVMNTPNVMRHLGGVQSFEAWSAAYDRLQNYQRDFGHTFWIVEARAGGELLGFCGLKRVNNEGAGALAGTAEIGWRLRESAWGKGIAKEAAIAAFDLGFDRFGYDAIVALTVPSNELSEGLMKRFGMVRRVDLDFIDPRFGPDLNPAIVYRMARSDWPAARAAAFA